MNDDKFTGRDYFSASLLRMADLEYLRLNNNSIILSVYCAGVAIECMLRAYIREYVSSEFDGRHDLRELYEKSGIASRLKDSEKEKLIAAVTAAQRRWYNNLRYTSDIRMKRIIGHNMARTKCKDINSYIKKYYSDIFDAANLIVKKGEEKWI
jgi:hypothetical protein